MEAEAKAEAVAVEEMRQAELTNLYDEDVIVSEEAILTPLDKVSTGRDCGATVSFVPRCKVMYLTYLTCEPCSDSSVDSPLTMASTGGRLFLFGFF